MRKGSDNGLVERRILRDTHGPAPPRRDNRRRASDAAGPRAGSGTRRLATTRLVRVPKKLARHRIYVIELDPAVLEHAKFRAANPNHDPRKPPLYVGMTGLDPETNGSS